MELFIQRWLHNSTRLADYNSKAEDEFDQALI